MEHTGNHITLCGTLRALPEYSHSNHERRFFRFELEVERLSGTADVLPVMAAEDVLMAADLFAGGHFLVEGQIRSFNSRAESGRRLIISVFAESVTTTEQPPQNDAVLTGTICKPPIYRRTPLGRSISDTEALMKSTGATLDDGTKQTLEGLAAVLRSTAKTMGTAGQIKDAKSSICDIIEDTWDEYTGDVNNLLLMDATAEAVSLTDSRNPSPESIQILIRTQEITMPDEDETEAEAAAEVQTTFWGRVAQMFKDFWAAITGLFGGKD